MKIFVNGAILPEQEARISVFDRGFLYGDGLFETLYVAGGKPFRWEDHWLRLSRGAEFIGLKLPLENGQALEALRLLISANNTSQALARISVSRGVGPRGYSPRGAENPTFVVSMHPAPDAATVRSASWALHISKYPLHSSDPLAFYKTANKMLQVIARAEAEAAGADEALLMDEHGHIVEAAAGNVFWVESDRILTPPIRGVLPGVTRMVVIELCAALGITVTEEAPDLNRLLQAQGIFVSLSTYGIVPAKSLNGVTCAKAALISELQTAYLRQLQVH